MGYTNFNVIQFPKQPKKRSNLQIFALVVLGVVAIEFIIIGVALWLM